MNEPDPSVVWAARAGSVEAFEELVRAYQADVWRLSLHLLRDPSVADDVTQDSFVRAFRFISTYKGRSKFTTWLLSIARNCAVDEIRRAGRRRKVEDELRAHSLSDPVEQGAGVEVREALDELPVDLREAVVLIDMLGLSYAETAGVLKLPVGTVKSRVHRARLTLARRLGDATEEASGES